MSRTLSGLFLVGCCYHWTENYYILNSETLLDVNNYITVRAKIITEFILERAGPVIFKTFFSGISSFQTDFSNFSARRVKPENYWK